MDVARRAGAGNSGLTSRFTDFIGRDVLVADPPVPMTIYRDDFGNWCTRIVAPKGITRISGDAIVRDSGLPDVLVSGARQTPVPDLPDETLIFCRVVGTATPIGCRRRRGTCSNRRRRAGTASGHL